MDSCANPNVISPQIVKHLSLSPKGTNNVVTVANGDKSGVQGNVTDVPNLFEELTYRIYFIIRENVPFDLFIGRPTLKRLGGVLDFRAEEVSLHYKGQKAKLSIVSEYTQAQVLVGMTDSEDFTSDFDGAEPSLGGKGDAEDDLGEELVPTFQDSWTPKNSIVSGHEGEDRDSTIRRELGEKLSHLPHKTATCIKELFLDTNVVACSLHDLRPAYVSVEKSSELNDNIQIYHQGRRMAQKHNEIARRELGMMLEAGIITPATSAWSFPLEIATKKDGKPRFCVESPVLNRRTKADRFPLPKIQESFNELAGGFLFTTLGFFSGYWQVKRSENYNEKTTFVYRYGTFQFEVMPFGLMNAPSTF